MYPSATKFNLHLFNISLFCNDIPEKQLFPFYKNYSSSTIIAKYITHLCSKCVTKFKINCITVPLVTQYKKIQFDDYKCNRINSFPMNGIIIKLSILNHLNQLDYVVFVTQNFPISD